jgi:hypothetical protein
MHRARARREGRGPPGPGRLGGRPLKVLFVDDGRTTSSSRLELRLGRGLGTVDTGGVAAALDRSTLTSSSPTTTCPGSGRKRWCGRSAVRHLIVVTDRGEQADSTPEGGAHDFFLKDRLCDCARRRARAERGRARRASGVPSAARGGAPAPGHGERLFHDPVRVGARRRDRRRARRHPGREPAGGTAFGYEPGAERAAQRR